MIKPRFDLISSTVQARCMHEISTLQISPGDPWVIKIGKRGKTRDQECKYHAMIGDLAPQIEIWGRQWDEESLKRLLLDQFWRETKDDPEFADDWGSVSAMMLAPSIDGKGVVNLGIQSRKLTRKLGSAFITFIHAFAAENGVILE